MTDIVERDYPPKPNRLRANITAADLFEPSKPANAIPVAGKLTALQKAQAYVDRRETDAYRIACKTFMTNDRDPISNLPRPSLRFQSFVEQVQALIDGASA